MNFEFLAEYVIGDPNEWLICGNYFCHKTASIGAEASIGAGASIGAEAIIGAGASIGAGARIGEWASIGEYARIGERASIGEGANVTETWLYVQGSRHCCYWNDRDKGLLGVGCVIHSINTWLGSYIEIGAMYKYTPAQIEEYKRIIDLFAADFQSRQK